MIVRLANIVDDSPIEALSMTVHMAFVDDSLLEALLMTVHMASKCVDDSPIEVVEHSPVGEHCR
jgi:hypothetical protein